jgi:NADPH:quinone reductase-like Zn-dependent oxidoreductase
MSALVAASVPLSAQTALLGVRDLAQVKAGQQVFIHAAAGGVGQFALQMAVAANARVTGTASKGNLARLARLGAAETLDYATCDLRSHARRYDVVFDLIGGEIGAASMSLLKPGGIFLGATAPPDARAAQAASARTAFVAVQPDVTNLTLIRDQLESGALTLPPPIVFGLNEAAAAHTLSQGGHAPARIVLAPNP